MAKKFMTKTLSAGIRFVVVSLCSYGRDAIRIPNSLSKFIWYILTYRIFDYRVNV